jgi:hypothetical protein
MQLCSYAVMQLCSHAVMQSCSHAVIQLFSYSVMPFAVLRFCGFAARQRRACVNAVPAVPAVQHFSQFTSVQTARINATYPTLSSLAVLQLCSSAARQRRACVNAVPAVSVLISREVLMLDREPLTALTQARLWRAAKAQNCKLQTA